MKVILWKIILDLVKIISTIYTILVCTKAKKMNPTYEFVRQCFSQYPVTKSLKNYMYQCLVNFIFVFAFVPSFVFLGEVSYTDSQIL